MKIKKILIAFLVAIITFSSVVFATTDDSTNSANITNTTNTADDELSEEDLIPALEQKLKNETSNETENTVSNFVSNNTSSNETTSKSKSSSEKVLDDVYEISDNLNYELTYIDGNVYIIGQIVTFTNCEITGNLFVIAEELTLSNTVVDGSVYACSDTISITEKSSINSVYLIGNTVTINEKSEINDARIGAGYIALDSDILRNAYLAGDYVEISKNAEIKGIGEVYATEYDIPSNLLKSDNFTLEIIEAEEVTVDYKDNTIALVVEFIIVLILIIIILNVSPKFVSVNEELKPGNFVGSFFAGILEIIIISLILLTIMLTGYGSGYAFILLALLGIMLCLGEVVFIAALAIRLVKNINKNVKSKAFFYSMIIALILTAINAIAWFSNVGAYIVCAIHLILAVTGFGTLMKVLFTSKKKNNTIQTNPNPPVSEPIVEVKKSEEVKEEVVPSENEEEKTDDDSEKFEISGEIVKKDIKKKSKKKEEKTDDENK